MSTFKAASLTLIATLLALGILKHWFLVLPLPDSALWKSALGPRAPSVASREASKDEVP
ncbi:DUF3623 family protein [Thioflavicoccus mobilis]|uniref:DUF3623 family protein n=1 Tax=Thioflavicoccus mobilis TaxID=80679 RepID=UPI00031D9E91|nr:DUF3623 family protein [Thioflavicoccus mobilis]